MATEKAWPKHQVVARGGAVTEAALLTITAGATAQTALAANPARTALVFVNTSDTVMYVRFGATATAAAGIVVAVSGGQLLLEGNACPTDLVSVLCATTGKTFYCYEISG